MMTRSISIRIMNTTMAATSASTDMQAVVAIALPAKRKDMVTSYCITL